MKEKIFEQHSFTAQAKILFGSAAKVALALGDMKVACSHLFFSTMVFPGSNVGKLLGRELTKLPEKFDFRNIKLDEYNADGMDFADELSSLFLDESPGSPLNFIKDYFPGHEIGVAEIAFMLLMEPTEEISDILTANGITNDVSLLESLLKENYLKNVRDFSGTTSQERLSDSMQLAEKFETFMKSRICGQDKAVEELSAAFTDFWHRGNNSKPLSVVLLSKSGGGRSFFAETMQQAFVELGLQSKVEPPLDLSSFVHDMSCDNDLLGDAKSYRCAKPGKLYNMIRTNRRGMLVFEDILNGSKNAKSVLRSFANNLAFDKFHEETMILPFNILVFTMALPDEQYRFLAGESVKGLDARMLNNLLLGNKNNTAEAETAQLWQNADHIVMLQQLTDNDLEYLIDKELTKTQRVLQEEYNIDMSCENVTDLKKLLLQSAPEELSPGKVIGTFNDAIRNCWRVFSRNHNIRNFQLKVGNISEYRHDPERRIVRGDYLAFEKSEQISADTLTLSLENICYKQQYMISCGDYRIERPKGMTFDDIVGLDDVRDELLDALSYITSSDDRLLNLPPPNLNFILYGPPGTGKTILAVALANSAEIPVFFAASAIFANEKKLAEMFRKAKEMAPAIVVLEEFNSIGDASQPWRRECVNELLSILDGVQQQSKIMVIASTNHLNQIEKALLRPGRFGRQIKIDVPTAEAREDYIRRFEQKFKLTLADFDRERFVADTERLTLADLKGILEYALRHSIQRKQTLDYAGLETAFKKFRNEKNVRQSIGFGGGLEK